MSDFTYTCDRAIAEKIEFETEITTFGRFKEQRRGLVDDSRRQWKLKFDTRIQSEMEAVRDSFIAKKGRKTSFTWTNPNDSAEYTVRYIKDSFDFSRAGYQIYDFECSFKQVL